MRRYSPAILILGFTAIFVGYLSVWLRGPGAGLSFLGVEMGEWFKFAGLGPRRDIFYLPPVLLGLMLALWTSTWPAPTGGGFAWRPWAVRVLAVLVSFLAFPAIEDITGPVREQYLLRVFLIGLVIVVALLSAFWHPQGRWRAAPWLAIGALGILNLVLPTWLFAQAQSFLSSLLGVPVAAGMGLWLNGLGSTLVAVTAFYEGVTRSRSSSPARLTA